MTAEALMIPAMQLITNVVGDIYKDVKVYIKDKKQANNQDNQAGSQESGIDFDQIEKNLSLLKENLETMLIESTKEMKRQIHSYPPQTQVAIPSYVVFKFGPIHDKEILSEIEQDINSDEVVGSEWLDDVICEEESIIFNLDDMDESHSQTIQSDLIEPVKEYLRENFDVRVRSVSIY